MQLHDWSVLFCLLPDLVTTHHTTTPMLALRVTVDNTPRNSLPTKLKRTPLIFAQNCDITKYKYDDRISVRPTKYKPS
jgi:hypothetical protein